MTHYLVTGGAGFIGSHIVEILCSENHRVTVLDNLSTGDRDNVSDDSVLFIEGDIRDPAVCRQALKNVDATIHLAAQVSVPASLADARENNSINIDGTMTLLEAIATSPSCRALAFASTCAVYGDNSQLPLNEAAALRPLSPYAMSKLAGEHICHMMARLHAISIVAFRFFNVFGPRQNPRSAYASVIPIFIDRILNDDRALIYGDGEQTRDFVYVKDLARMVINGVNHPNAFPEHAYNIASGTATTVNSLYTQIQVLLESKTRADHAEVRNGDIAHSLGDATLLAKACDLVGQTYAIRPLEEALVETVSWYRRAAGQEAK